MVYSLRTWLMVLCTFGTYLGLLGLSHMRLPHLAHRIKLPPIDVDKYTTTWSELGIAEHSFLGTWANTTYQATVWLRLMPAPSHKGFNEVRLVLRLNRAPAMFIHDGVHAVTPEAFLVDGRLPALTLLPTASPGSKAEAVTVALEYWDEYIRSKWLAGTINGRALLRSDTIYTLSMEGSLQLLQIPPFRGSRAHAMFQDGQVWIGAVESLVADRDPPPFQFLVLEHVRYHMRLGVRGLLLVVLPETAAMLLADARIKDVVQKRQLVLVLWEHGHGDGSRYVLQLPANNLLKAAMAGTNTTLGLWDLDEFLVLPRHRNISYEVNHGCLTQLHDPANQEAVLPFSLALGPDSWHGSELPYWQAHGGLEAAVRHMHYSAQPLLHCDGGVYCKALINPNSVLNMHVHQMVRRPPASCDRVPSDRACAYMVHFQRLWGRRAWWSMDVLGKKQPLALRDLPFAA